MVWELSVEEKYAKVKLVVEGLPITNNLCESKFSSNLHCVEILKFVF